jgi:hypothetical protein
MPKHGPDSVEVRSRVGDARQFSPSAARNCGPIREVLGFCRRRASRSKLVSVPGSTSCASRRLCPGSSCDCLQVVGRRAEGG